MLGTKPETPTYKANVLTLCAISPVSGMRSLMVGMQNLNINADHNVRMLLIQDIHASSFFYKISEYEQNILMTFGLILAPILHYLHHYKTNMRK